MNKFREILCDFCSNKISDSRLFTLPCGYWVCMDHLKTPNASITCPVCQDHEISLNECFSMRKNKIKLKENELDSKIRDLNKQVDIFKQIRNDPEYLLSTNFQNLINKIDLRREILKLDLNKQIDDYHEKLTQMIIEKQEKFLKKFDDNLKSIKMDDLDSNLLKGEQTNSEKLKNTQIIYSKIEKITNKIDILNKLIEESKEFDLIVKETKLKFNLENLFGVLKMYNSIKCPNLDRLVCLSEFSQHSAQVIGISELKSGEVISWSKDKSVKIWSQTSGECSKSVNIGVFSLKITDSDRIVALLEDNYINVYDLNFSILNSLKSETKILCFELAKNFDIFAGCENGNIKVFKKNNNYSDSVIDAHHKPVKCLSLFNNAEIISASEDGLKIWNLKTFECLRVCEQSINHVLIVNSLEFLTVDNKEIKLWTKKNDNTVNAKTLQEKKSNILMSQMFDDDNSCVYLRSDNNLLEELDLISNKVKSLAEIVGIKCFKVLKSGFLFTGLENGLIKKWLTK